MQLGVVDPPPRRHDVVRQQTPQNNCKKWRRIAERLGETLAGLRLRQSVVDRACLFAETELASVGGALGDGSTGFEHLWSWPWADGAIDPTLPPRLHGTYGDWSIRCGRAGSRERCALIHDAAAQPDATATIPALAAEPARIVTHFVIDTISGHTHIVWRVFVAGSLDLARSDLVRFTVGTFTGGKRFDGCSNAGCLMEADMTTSARVATRLWEGLAGTVSLQSVSGTQLTAAISATGVRAGLGELARLKRAEDKILAGN
jgi:invasion protein IalB